MLGSLLDKSGDHKVVTGRRCLCPLLLAFIFIAQIQYSSAFPMLIHFHRILPTTTHNEYKLQHAVTTH